MIIKKINSPIVKGTLIGILILLILFMFPSMRVFAADFLSLFRVQQVLVLPIDSINLENTTNQAEPLGVALSRLFSSSTLVTDETEEPIIVSTLEDANKITDFEARLPYSLTPIRIVVIDSTSFIMTLDQLKIQSLLNNAGRSDLQLPNEIDGAEIFIKIPFTVRADFGDCSVDCIVFSQMPSPTADVPDTIDISELAKIGLRFTGMNNEEADQFSEDFDWTTTLVIPIPRDRTSYTEVPVDGVVGKLIQRSIEPNISYLLLWVKNDIIYAISGRGIDTTIAFDIANSLP